VTAAALSGRALQLARAGYGAALVLAPGPAILLATGRLPGRRACRVARLLGARHLAQATLTALTPLPVFGAGAGVDALHAASMLMLAAVDRAARRAALTDTVAEAAFAATGLAAAASRRGGTGR
jgi:hypothetical protein